MQLGVLNYFLKLVTLLLFFFSLHCLVPNQHRWGFCWDLVWVFCYRFFSSSFVLERFLFALVMGKPKQRDAFVAFDLEATMAPIQSGSS